MKKTMRIFAAALAAAAAATAFSACGKQDDFMPKPPPSPTEFVRPTPDGDTTGLPEILYKGDGSVYIYSMDEGRDRQCEEDIVTFADKFLDKEYGHPALVDREIIVQTYNKRNYPDNESISFYNEELRDEFIARINELLRSIPERSDREIVLGLAEAAALLGDAETGLNLYSPQESTFILYVEPLYDGTFGYFITSTEKAYEQYLMCRIDAINGVDINEVVTKCRDLQGCASDISAIQNSSIAGGNTPPLFMFKSVLQHFGIMGEEDTATFTLTNRDGETFEVEVQTVPFTEFREHELVGCAQDDETLASDVGLGLITSHDKYDYTPSWCGMIDDGSTLYVHLNQDASQDMNHFQDDMQKLIEETGTIDRVIIDTRRTNGYVEMSRIMGLLNQIEAKDGKFVFMDYTTDSGGTAMVAMLKRFLDGAILVGTSTGGTTALFRKNVFSLENLWVGCWCSAEMGYDYYPGYKGTVIMPDEIVYQTVDDYAAGIDSLLKSLLQ